MEINKNYNEDCIDTMSRMPDNFIDMTITSPPYCNARNYSTYNSVNAYMDEMKTIFVEVFRVLSLSRMCVINVSPILIPREKRSKQSYRVPIPFYFVPMMEKIGFEFLEDIIWEKPDGSAKNRGGGFFQHRKPVAYKPNLVAEYILVFKKPAPFLIDKILREQNEHIISSSLVEDGYERTNIWKINPETKSEHPAPFPEELAEKVIIYYSYINDKIYDPFMGSGTTAKMAIKNNRRWIGSEISKEYCNIINERI